MATIAPIILDDITVDIVEDLITDTNDDPRVIAETLIESVLGGYDDLRKYYYSYSAKLKKENPEMDDEQAKELALADYKEYIQARLSGLGD